LSSTGLEHRAGLAARLVEARGLLGGDEPWVVADDFAAFERFLEPLGRRMVDQVARFEQPGSTCSAS
jgi:hypothetical protein